MLSNKQCYRINVKYLCVCVCVWIHVHVLWGRVHLLVENENLRSGAPHTSFYWIHWVIWCLIEWIYIFSSNTEEWPKFYWISNNKPLPLDSLWPCHTFGVIELGQHWIRAPSQYPKRRLFVRSRKVSKPRDWYFKLSYRFEIWQAHRQHCCRSACQISERSDNSKYKSRGFETLRDLTKRRLFGIWDGAQVVAGTWPPFTNWV